MRSKSSKPSRSKSNRNRNSKSTSKQTQTSSSKPTKPSKNKNKQTQTNSVTQNTGQVQNKYFQLLFGLLTGFAGLNEKEIATLNSCLPDSWKGTDTTPAAGDSLKGQSKSTWTIILDGVEKVIGLICKFKSQIKDMIKRRIRRQVKRSHYKILFQRSMSRYKYNRAKDFFGSIKKAWNAGTKIVSGGAKRAWNAGGKIVSSGAKIVSSGAKRVLKAGQDIANAGWEAVKHYAKDIVKNLPVFIDSIRQNVTNFLNSDFVQKLKQFFNCVSVAKKAALSIIDKVKNLVGLVGKITLIVGGDLVTLGKLVVDLICNFSTFRKAFTFLADAIGTSDTLRKWNLIGSFIGTLFNAIAVRRLKI